MVAAGSMGLFCTTQNVMIFLLQNTHSPPQISPTSDDHYHVQRQCRIALELVKAGADFEMARCCRHRDLRCSWLSVQDDLGDAGCGVMLIWLKFPNGARSRILSDEGSRSDGISLMVVGHDPLMSVMVGLQVLGQRLSWS